MKLYNHTKYPDAVLESLLVKAGKAVGARTTGVVVIVNQGRQFGASIPGCAYRATSVRPNLRMKRDQNYLINIRWVKTDGGYFTIVAPHWNRPALEAVQNFYATAVHEWGHIKDFQRKDLPEWSRRDSSGRRPRWEDRPEEIRANEYRDSARSQGKGENGSYAYEEIVGLALALEERKESK